MLAERGAVLEAPKEDDEKGFAECQMADVVVASVDHILANYGGGHTRSGYLKAFQSAG